MPGGRPLVRRAGGCPRPAPMNRIGSEFIHVGIRHPDNPEKRAPQGSYRPAAPFFIGHGSGFRNNNYFAYNRNFMLHVPPGAIDRKPSASGSGMFGALVVHDCGSGQQ